MAGMIKFTDVGSGPLFAFPDSQAPSFGNWSDPAIRIPVPRVNGHCEVVVDIETHGNIWYVFEGEDVPVSWDAWAHRVDFSSTTPAIVVYPLAGSDVPRVSNSTIHMYQGEVTTASISVSGDVDLTPLVLVMIIQRMGGTDVVKIGDEQIERTTRTFTVTVPQEVTLKPNQFDWSLRIAVGNVLLAHGVLTVSPAAAEDVE